MRILIWAVSILAAAALIAGGVFFFQLQSTKAQLKAEILKPQQLHFSVRLTYIGFELQEAKAPIVMVGDSITEMTRFPESLNGTQVVNAGIGGALVANFVSVYDIIAAAKPSVIVTAIGVNDALGNNANFERDYDAHLTALKKISPRVVAVSLSPLVAASTSQANSTIEALAKKHGVEFLQLDFTGYKTLDGAHPDAASKQKRADQIMDRIK